MGVPIPGHSKRLDAEAARRWRRVHRGSVAIGRCPECGKVEECGHGWRGRVTKRGGGNVNRLSIALAHETAARAEEELLATMEDALARLRTCGGCRHARDGHADGEGACGREGCGCGGFVWSVTQGEAVGTVMMLERLARHTQRIDADLGLDVKKIAVQGSPIASLMEKHGVTLEEFKKMAPAERADMMLRIQRGDLVVDAEVVSKDGESGAPSDE